MSRSALTISKLRRRRGGRGERAAQPALLQQLGNHGRHQQSLSFPKRHVCAEAVVVGERPTTTKDEGQGRASCWAGHIPGGRGTLQGAGAHAPSRHPGAAIHGDRPLHAWGRAAGSGGRSSSKRMAGGQRRDLQAWPALVSCPKK